jgi:two-component system response regulator FlrC
VRGLTHETLEALSRYPWPGNVRELDNLMQRTLILQPGAEIQAGDLQFEPCSVVSKIPAEPTRGKSLGEDLRSREEEMILTTLRAVIGNRAAAAARLGISPRALRYKLARMRAAGIAIPGENV